MPIELDGAVTPSNGITQAVTKAIATAFRTDHLYATMSPEKRRFRWKPKPRETRMLIYRPQ